MHSESEIYWAVLDTGNPISAATRRHPPRKLPRPGGCTFSTLSCTFENPKSTYLPDFDFWVRTMWCKLLPGQMCTKIFVNPHCVFKKPLFCTFAHLDVAYNIILPELHICPAMLLAPSAGIVGYPRLLHVNVLLSSRARVRVRATACARARSRARTYARARA